MPARKRPHLPKQSSNGQCRTFVGALSASRLLSCGAGCRNAAFSSETIRLASNVLGKANVEECCESENMRHETRLAGTALFRAASPGWLASARMRIQSSHSPRSWVLNMFHRSAGNISPMLARLMGGDISPLALQRFHRQHKRYPRLESVWRYHGTSLAIVRHVTHIHAGNMCTLEADTLEH